MKRNFIYSVLATSLLFVCRSAASNPVTPAASPTIIAFTPSTGSVGTLVTVTGSNLNNPTAFTIGGVTAIAVSNNDTTLVGMVMPGATTGTAVVTTTGGTATGTGNFTVTPTPAPSAQQGSKLVGTESKGASCVYQGNSISISADGNTAIVGGFGDNITQGAAWVFTRSGNTWTQQGNKLVGTGAIDGASQGISVSISADGNTALVGGHSDNGTRGATWVYTRSGGIWTQQGKKLVGTGSVGTFTSQGWSVSLSADGNTALVGGYADNNLEGAAWVFTRSGSTWTQQGDKLVGTGNIYPAYQGSSVSLSADGNTAIVGGPHDNYRQGAAWVFTRSGSTWTQQGDKLVGAGNKYDAYQGSSVSLSADGNTAIIGGIHDNGYQSAAWVYTRSGNTWTQQGNKLVGTGASANFPTCSNSVSLSADGNTAMVGGNHDSSGAAAWVYTRAEGVWKQQGNKLVGTGIVGDASQSSSVSLSADGTTAMVGACMDNNSLGTAWVFIPVITTTPAAPTISFPSAEILLYPNPATDNFSLNSTTKASISIYDFNGRQMLRTTLFDNKVADVSDLPVGVYSVRIVTAERVIQQKLIKK